MSILARVTIISSYVSGTQTFGSLTIILTDAATGAPVNGNGVAVDYELNLNGSITTGTVYIMGQQLPLYSGKLADNSVLSPYFVKYYANVNTTKKPCNRVRCHLCNKQ